MDRFLGSQTISYAKCPTHPKITGNDKNFPVWGIILIEVILHFERSFILTFCYIKNKYNDYNGTFCTNYGGISKRRPVYATN